MRLTRFLRRPKARHRRLYLDYAAATPVSRAAKRVMRTTQDQVYGNAGGIHYEAQAAQQVIEDGRASLARLFGIRPNEVIFTASGTESNNLAIFGVIESAVAAGTPYEELEILTTKLEHPSVLNAVQVLNTRGVAVQYLPVNEYGEIATNDVAALVSEKTTLVTFAYVNSEIGTIQPVKRMTRIIKKRNPATIVHLDAAQAPLWLPCQMPSLGVDLISLDAGKCNGPKGVGILLKRAAITLAPVIHGGGQEAGLRSGTENTAGIAGAVVALAEAQADHVKRSARAHTLAVALQAALSEHVPEIIYNGPPVSDIAATGRRLPNNVHISLPGVDTEYAVVYLDTHGIAASTRSACSGAGGGVSTVVMVATGDAARALSTIRFSIDPQLKTKDMERVASRLRDHLTLMKSLDHNA